MTSGDRNKISDERKNDTPGVSDRHQHYATQSNCESQKNEGRARDLSNQSNQKRLDRNKQSAKESRLRKKQFQQDMETQLTRLRDENLQLRKKHQEYIERERLQSIRGGTSIQTNSSEKLELYKVIEDKLKNKEIANQAELDTILHMLLDRKNTDAVQRKLKINSLFKALLSASFPSHL